MSKLVNKRLFSSIPLTIPHRLFLVRHGESKGNVAESAYATIPDNSIPLTRRGWEQAIRAGKQIKHWTQEESVRFIVSPYVRTMETFHGIVKSWDADSVSWREDPRLREQDFGNFQNPNKDVLESLWDEKTRYGPFYYRFPNGESSADVYDRVSSFLESLHRDWEWSSQNNNLSQNYIIVCHGLTIRVFLMRWFKYTVDQFEALANPRNCEIVMLKRHSQSKPPHRRWMIDKVWNAEDEIVQNSLRFRPPEERCVRRYRTEPPNEDEE